MSDEPGHGEMVKEGKWQGSRRCLVCEYGYHGPLFVCQHYSDEVKAEIKNDGKRFVQNTRSRAWWQGQVDRGNIRPEDLPIMQAVYGMPVED